VPLENPSKSEPTRIILLFELALRLCLSKTPKYLSRRLALRQQINVLRRSLKKRPKLSSGDRLFRVSLSRLWRDWPPTLVIVKPETVVALHRKGFRLLWTGKVRRGQPGRPGIPREIRDLIHRMCRENPSWGAPRIHGELLKLGIAIGETSVSKYMVRGPQAAFSDLAYVPGEPRLAAGCRRLLYRPHHPLPGPVRLSATGP
jgi:hypothetical protein